MTALDTFEILRRSHRPKRIRVLFIGESRPANGTFFFAGDSRLAKYTAEAFDAVYGPFPDAASFLECFRDLGCYLVDLCPTPVNELPRKERATVRRVAESSLKSTLIELKPLAIVVVMKAILKSVARAAMQANADAIATHALSFPAQGHEREYVSGLIRVISGLKRQRLLKNAC